MSDLKGETLTPPQPTEEADKSPQKTFTRGSFIKGILGGLLAGSFGGGTLLAGAKTYDKLTGADQEPSTDEELAKKFLKEVTPTVPATATASATSTPTAVPTAPTQKSEVKVELTPISERGLLNNVAKTVLNTSEREQAEDELFNYLLHKHDLTAQDIDQGLWVIVDHTKRDGLLNLRYQLRTEQRDPKLKPLPKDKEQWALDHAISPETLAIALDAYPRAQRIIEALIKDPKQRQLFRPDISYREGAQLLPKGTFENLTADQIMINPGGMAQLIITETGGVTYVLANGKDVTEKPIHEGFTTIGNHSAWEETNINFFPTGHISLENLTELLKLNTLVDYQARNIPGSARGDTSINASGGAVGIQMMADNIMKIIGLINNPEIPLKEEDRWLNIFDLESATVLAWIFIAMGEKVGKEPGAFRSGYLRGPQDAKAPQNVKDYFAKLRNWAIEKWNPFKPQRDSIIQAANDYSDKFPS